MPIQATLPRLPPIVRTTTPLQKNVERIRKFTQEQQRIKRREEMELMQKMKRPPPGKPSSTPMGGDF